MLFVTSQTRGRWVLPKGRREKGESHEDTCHREGFEEAGIRGRVLGDFPTTALMTKLTNAGLQHNPVTYYPFLVVEQTDAWPEKKQRERRWIELGKTSEIESIQDHAPLIDHFERFRKWILEAAVTAGR